MFGFLKNEILLRFDEGTGEKDIGADGGEEGGKFRGGGRRKGGEGRCGGEKGLVRWLELDRVEEKRIKE